MWQKEFKHIHQTPFSWTRRDCENFFILTEVIHILKIYYWGTTIPTKKKKKKPQGRHRRSHFLICMIQCIVLCTLTETIGVIGTGQRCVSLYTVTKTNISPSLLTIPSVPWCWKNAPNYLRHYQLHHVGTQLVIVAPRKCAHHNY